MFWTSNLTCLLAQAAAKPPGGDSVSSIALKLLLAVAIIVGSFALGPILARMLKIPEFGTKFGVILFTLIASLAVCITGWPPKRGIDLSGGVQLVYEVNQQEVASNNLEKVVSSLNSGLKAEGVKGLLARPGNGTVEVFINEPDEISVDTAKEKIAAVSGSANALVNLNTVRETKQGNKTVLVYEVPQNVQSTVKMDDLVTAVSRRVNPGGIKELTIRSYGPEQVEVIIPEVDKQEVEKIKQTISTSGYLEFRIVADRQYDRDIIALAEEQSPANVIYKGATPVARWVKLGPNVGTEGAVVRESKSRGPEVLMVLDEQNVTGKYLTSARKGLNGADFAVHFTFNSDGGNLFGELTGDNYDPTNRMKRRLGIVLDGTLVSAPQINGPITTDGEITGHFSDQEVSVLVDVLNAGSLPAALRPDPISQEEVSPEMGEDTIRMGTYSMIASTVAILLFMLVYYRFAGFVADTAVMLNILVTVALMIAIKAAFTLTGLAGLVLTVGMAVDANVLIYERMREESRHGSSLRMTIRNGFSRAMNTIIDSHCTTLTSGIVLFMIGTDQIKGFAVTLTIGLLLSLFTAIFVARVLFDVAEKKRWLTKLNMMHLIRETHIDFIGLQWPAIAVSVILIVVGLIAVGYRGAELFDIDFTGGSSVQMVFNEGHDISDVRKRVGELKLEDASVSSVGLDKAELKNREFKIDTSNDNIKDVQETLNKGFTGELKTYSMEYGGLAMIEKPATPPGIEANPKPKGDDLGPAPGKSDEEKAAPEKSTESNGSKDIDSKGTGSKDTGAEEKPATPPAADKKPAEPSPEEKKAEEKKPEKPAKGDSSRAMPSGARRFGRHPVSAEIAAVGRDDIAVASLLLAAAEDKPADAKAEKPAVEKAADEKQPEDKPAAKDSSEPVKGADETAKETKPEPGTEAKPADDKDGAAKSKTYIPEPGKTSAGPGAAGNGILVDESFVGGTRAELKFPTPIKYSVLQEMVQAQLKKAGLDVPFELSNPKYAPGSELPYADWTLEIKLPQDKTESLLKAIRTELMQTPIFPSSSKIGGKVASDTQWIAVKALLASMLVIVVYIWIRFQNVIFGVGAIVATVHDVLITLGFIALSSYLAPYLGIVLVDPFKISLSVVAALLTVVGYSINDTIVVFDRIREVRGKSPDLTEKMINDSVNQTLSRTLLTSGTVFIGAFILYVMGGPGIHAFAYAMLVGVIAGTYSSIYIASPILLWMKKPPAKENGALRGVQAAAASSKGNRNIM